MILGALAIKPFSGYEIKQLVDRSTRFFWAASYGQIYPELRRLEAEGLIRGESDDQGGRRRNRYHLTDAGLERLRAWLLEPHAGYETRDEGLLKLFFARALEPRDVLALVRAMRADREAVLAEIRVVEAMGIAKDTAELVLNYGLRLHEWMIEWLREAERRLERTLETNEGAR